MVKIVGPEGRVYFVNPAHVQAVRPGILGAFDSPGTLSVLVMSGGYSVECVQSAERVAIRLQEEQ